MKPRKRTICFVTGTRAEFGLMRTTLAAIAAEPSLQLQLIVTGMHLSRVHGRSIDDVRASGLSIDGVVPWAAGERPSQLAAATGKAVAALARQFDRLQSDVVLVVGDRVEAFAAATAAHLSGRIVAHVHGGDRAAGQVDDALRHAISKLAHVHFPATVRSAKRLVNLGEDRWRIHRVGAPGIDQIKKIATPRSLLRRRITHTRQPFALLVLHPTDADTASEAARATLVLAAARQATQQVIIVYPNNDPGSAGIRRAWDELSGSDDVMVIRNLARADFLGLLRDARFLVGNSSAGIIEAASFGTSVIDIGRRQLGREHGATVIHVPFKTAAIARACKAAADRERSARKNVYGGGATGKRIARTLARLIISSALRQKLIAY